MPSLFKRSIAIAALAGCCLLHAAEPTAKSPLLVNFDFESTDGHAVWKEMSSKEVKPSLVAIDSSDPHSGRAALTFQATSESQAARFIFTGINLPTERPKRIRVRLYARTANLNAGDAEVNILERDASKVLGWCGDQQLLFPIDAGNEWKEYSTEVPLRDDARVLTFFVRINNPTADKTVWIDDASIEFVDAAE